MRRGAACTAIAILVALGSPTRADGQSYSTPVLHRPAPVTADAVVDGRSAPRAPAGGGVAHDAVVGAGIGAGLGLVAAVIATTQSSVTDHSEDALGYVVFITLGAGLGLAVGAVVGLVRQ